MRGRNLRKIQFYTHSLSDVISDPIVGSWVGGIVVCCWLFLAFFLNFFCISARSCEVKPTLCIISVTSTSSMLLGSMIFFLTSESSLKPEVGSVDVGRFSPKIEFICPHKIVQKISTIIITFVILRIFTVFDFHDFNRFSTFYFFFLQLFTKLWELSLFRLFRLNSFSKLIFKNRLYF